MGKEAVQEAKAVGKLAKTVQAPYRANGPVISRLGIAWTKRLPVLTVLEKAAEKQPSILKAMKKHKETARRTNGEIHPGGRHTDER